MPRKDQQMDWDQIESKWAAMTRRVRADLPPCLADGKGASLRRSAKVAVKTTVVADRQIKVDPDKSALMSTE